MTATELEKLEPIILRISEEPALARNLSQSSGILFLPLGIQ